MKLKLALCLGLLLLFGSYSKSEDTILQIAGANTTGRSVEPASWSARERNRD